MNESFIQSMLPFCKLYTFNAIESTNSFSKDLKDDFALVIADTQTQGRGRMGKSFSSPENTGLYMSVVLKVPNMYQNIPFITTAAAVAVHKAIFETAKIKTGIKWVNDIYIGKKKVSGILCESIDSERAVIGIGINLLPNNLPEIATSLFEKDLPISKEELIVTITKNLTDIIHNLPDTSFMEYYKENSMVLGKEIVCIQSDKTFLGKAMDIDSRGGLVVLTKTGLTTLSTGEISIRFTD